MDHRVIEGRLGSNSGFRHPRRIDGERWGTERDSGRVNPLGIVPQFCIITTHVIGRLTDAPEHAHDSYPKQPSHYQIPQRRLDILRASTGQPCAPMHTRHGAIVAAPIRKRDPIASRAVGAAVQRPAGRWCGTSDPCHATLAYGGDLGVWHGAIKHQCFFEPIRREARAARATPVQEAGDIFHAPCRQRSRPTTPLTNNSTVPPLKRRAR